MAPGQLESVPQSLPPSSSSTASSSSTTRSSSRGGRNGSGLRNSSDDSTGTLKTAGGPAEGEMYDEENGSHINVARLLAEKKDLEGKMAKTTKDHENSTSDMKEIIRGLQRQLEKGSVANSGTTSGVTVDEAYQLLLRAHDDIPEILPVRLLGQATKFEVRRALRAAKIPLTDNLDNACMAIESYISDESFDPFTRDEEGGIIEGKTDHEQLFPLGQQYGMRCVNLVLQKRKERENLQGRPSQAVLWADDHELDLLQGIKRMVEALKQVYRGSGGGRSGSAAESIGASLRLERNRHGVCWEEWLGFQRGKVGTTPNEVSVLTNDVVKGYRAWVLSSRHCSARTCDMYLNDCNKVIRGVLRTLQLPHEPMNLEVLQEFFLTHKSLIDADVVANKNLSVNQAINHLRAFLKLDEVDLEERKAQASALMGGGEEVDMMTVAPEEGGGGAAATGTVGPREESPLGTSDSLKQKPALDLSVQEAFTVWLQDNTETKFPTWRIHARAVNQMFRELLKDLDREGDVVGPDEVREFVMTHRGMIEKRAKGDSRKFVWRYVKRFLRFLELENVDDVEEDEDEGTDDGIWTAADKKGPGRRPLADSVVGGIMTQELSMEFNSWLLQHMRKAEGTSAEYVRHAHGICHYALIEIAGESSPPSRQLNHSDLVDLVISYEVPLRKHVLELRKANKKGHVAGWRHLMVFLGIVDNEANWITASLGANTPILGPELRGGFTAFARSKGKMTNTEVEESVKIVDKTVRSCLGAKPKMPQDVSEARELICKHEQRLIKVAESSSKRRSALFHFVDYICGLTPLSDPSSDTMEVGEDEEEDTSSSTSLVKTISQWFGSWLRQQNYDGQDEGELDVEKYQSALEEILTQIPAFDEQKNERLDKKAVLALLLGKRDLFESAILAAQERQKLAGSNDINYDNHLKFCHPILTKTMDNCSSGGGGGGTFQKLQSIRERIMSLEIVNEDGHDADEMHVEDAEKGDSRGDLPRPFSSRQSRLPTTKKQQKRRFSSAARGLSEEVCDALAAFIEGRGRARAASTVDGYVRLIASDLTEIIEESYFGPGDLPQIGTAEELGEFIVKHDTEVTAKKTASITGNASWNYALRFVGSLDEPATTGSKKLASSLPPRSKKRPPVVVKPPALFRSDSGSVGSGSAAATDGGAAGSFKKAISVPLRKLFKKFMRKRNKNLGRDTRQLYSDLICDVLKTVMQKRGLGQICLMSIKEARSFADANQKDIDKACQSYTQNSSWDNFQAFIGMSTSRGKGASAGAAPVKRLGGSGFGGGGDEEEEDDFEEEDDENDEDFRPGRNSRKRKQRRSSPNQPAKRRSSNPNSGGSGARRTKLHPIIEPGLAANFEVWLGEEKKISSTHCYAGWIRKLLRSMLSVAGVEPCMIDAEDVPQLLDEIGDEVICAELAIPCKDGRHSAWRSFLEYVSLVTKARFDSVKIMGISSSSSSCSSTSKPVTKKGRAKSEGRKKRKGKEASALLAAPTGGGAGMEEKKGVKITWKDLLLSSKNDRAFDDDEDEVGVVGEEDVEEKEHEGEEEEEAEKEDEEEEEDDEVLVTGDDDDGDDDVLSGMEGGEEEDVIPKPAAYLPPPLPPPFIIDQMPLPPVWESVSSNRTE